VELAGNDILLLDTPLSNVITPISLSIGLTFTLRRCRRTAFVDRQEYEATQIIICPLPNCIAMWCKFCQQDVEIGGPPHSCDGVQELDHLMNNEGWKYCPGKC
jgi:hypothetical protein